MRERGGLRQKRQLQETGRKKKGIRDKCTDGSTQILWEKAAGQTLTLFQLNGEGDLGNDILGSVKNGADEELEPVTYTPAGNALKIKLSFDADADIANEHPEEEKVNTTVFKMVIIGQIGEAPPCALMLKLQNQMSAKSGKHYRAWPAIVLDPEMPAIVLDPEMHAPQQVLGFWVDGAFCVMFFGYSGNGTQREIIKRYAVMDVKCGFMWNVIKSPVIISRFSLLGMRDYYCPDCKAKFNFELSDLETCQPKSSCTPRMLWCKKNRKCDVLDVSFLRAPKVSCPFFMFSRRQLHCYRALMVIIGQIGEAPSCGIDAETTGSHFLLLSYE
ncbi:hypothetical protein L1987_18643 [Smallanthus sonchifolius]|uniref:Uncharacterized protein n=1 Tax=Smallanthus sonchifolius TaxID=185202 RepID=A0ACB9J0B7_9ASTR|nr:hypothetical protein L1987_18643 [Smallanthus sonchifolius]